jgi:hypothetical protein
LRKHFYSISPTGILRLRPPVRPDKADPGYNWQRRYLDLDSLIRESLLLKTRKKMVRADG